MRENPSTKQNAAILKALGKSSRPLAAREIKEVMHSNGDFYNENGISTRLPGLKVAGVVDCKTRSNREKEWFIVRAQAEQLPGMAA